MLSLLQAGQVLCLDYWAIGTSVYVLVRHFVFIPRRAEKHSIYIALQVSFSLPEKQCHESENNIALSFNQFDHNTFTTIMFVYC